MGFIEDQAKANADAIRGRKKATMAEGKYSVELEKLLHDLEERPASLLRGHIKLANKIVKLSSEERDIWFEHLNKYSAEQRDKFQTLVNKDY